MMVKKCKKKLRCIDITALIFLILSGVTHFILSTFNFSLINSWFGLVPFLPKILYILMGVSALWISIRLITNKLMKK